MLLRTIAWRSRRPSSSKIGSARSRNSSRRPAAVALRRGPDVVRVRERLPVAERGRRLGGRLGSPRTVVDLPLAVEHRRVRKLERHGLALVRVRGRLVVQRERVLVAAVPLGDDAALAQQARAHAAVLERHARTRRRPRRSAPPAPARRRAPRTPARARSGSTASPPRRERALVERRRRRRSRTSTARRRRRAPRSATPSPTRPPRGSAATAPRVELGVGRAALEHVADAGVHLAAARERQAVVGGVAEEVVAERRWSGPVPRRRTRRAASTAPGRRPRQAAPRRGRRASKRAPITDA